MQWRNDGDGIAHAVKVTSDECDVVLMLDGEQYLHGFDIVTDIPLLRPGETFISIFLPRNKTDLEHVDVTLEYLEEPTRLHHSRVSKRISLPYRLRGLCPLENPEKRVAWADLREASDRMGYGSSNAEVAYFVQQVCPEYLDKLGLHHLAGNHQRN